MPLPDCSRLHDRAGNDPVIVAGVFDPYPLYAVGGMQTVSYDPLYRFTGRTVLQEKKHALSFQRKAAEAILSAAQTHLCEAKRLHDQLEALYHDGVDFNLVERRTAALAEAVARRYPVVL